VLLSQLIKDISRVHTRVVSKLSWNDFESLSEGVNNELGLALNGAEVFSEISREFHFDGTTTSND
jgi:hypothetical protein